MQEADFRLRLVTPDKPPPEIGDRAGLAPADFDPSEEQIMEALMATPGAEELIAKFPDLGEIFDFWFEVAYFSVCEKRGNAYWLDVWDDDHFDGLSDIGNDLEDCRLWFSGDGFDSWGSPETKTGTVNCYFVAPVAGRYRCTASLQSYPSGQLAMVNCEIDGSSFGDLPFVGTVHQPHFSDLTKGGHAFRITQKQGGWYFLSLKVDRLWIPVVSDG